jgi:hypothetical protein
VAETNYTIALDTEGTHAQGHRYVQYAGEFRSHRAGWLQSVGEAVDALGDWADDFKHQMKQGTLPAAQAAGERVADGYEHLGRTMIKHSQVMPQTDADNAAQLNGIET